VTQSDKKEKKEGRRDDNVVLPARNLLRKKRDVQKMSEIPAADVFCLGIQRNTVGERIIISRGQLPCSASKLANMLKVFDSNFCCQLVLITTS
jgi:hypothetical protein